MAGDSGTRIGKKRDEADDRFSSSEYSTSAGVNGGGGKGGGGTSRGASPNDARAARCLQDDELGDSAGASAGCRMASFTERPPVETDTCASDVAHGLAEEEEELTDAQGAATAGRVLAAAFSAGRV